MTGQTFTAAAVRSTLVGTSGDDTFNGSQAGDTLTGGAGADVFHFATKPWEPTHITDFQAGVDKLDLSDLLKAVGYAGSDPIGDQYIRFMDNGAGGTKVLFDRDGAATGQLWPDRILELDNLAYAPANAGLMLSGAASSGGSTTPPLPSSGDGTGQVFTATSIRSSLVGTGGADTFNGSEAADTLTGGAGSDVFAFARKPWEPTHITDFQIGADKLDLSALLKAVGYAGADPIADRYIQFMDNGAGGTKVLFDRDGAATGQPWPDRILELDNVAFSPANASQMLVGSSAGGSTTPPPSSGGGSTGGSTGGSSGAGQVYTAADVRSTLIGTGGADTFNGSQAGDTITGGAGADVFHFGAKPWEPTHITDFQVGSDKLDLSDLLKAVGYAGSDAIADQYIQFMDNGAGGTKVLFDRDGAASGQQWPDRILELDNVAFTPANASQMLSGSPSTGSGGGTTTPPPPPPTGGGGSTPADGAFVLFAGQSNTGGNYTTASQVDAAWKPDPLTQIWNQQTHAWEQMVPGQNTGWSNGALANSWGPEVEYAIQFRAAYPTEKLYILKQADGGTTLANDWDPDLAGRLFDNVTNLVHDAGGALGGRKPDVLFWGQGETDGNTLASAQAYGTNLTEFVTAARGQWLGDASGKIALFRVDTSPPYATYVRQGQMAVDQADANVVSFDTVSFPVQSDNLHFAAAGLDMVGASYFDAYAAWRTTPRLGLTTAWQYKDEGQSGGAAFSYAVARTGDASGPVSVTWSVKGAGANPANGADFVGGAPPSGTLTFAAGETAKTIVFSAAGDTAVEPSERFTVTLSNAGGALIGAGTAQGTIIDDDGLRAPAPGTNGALVSASGMNSFLAGTTGTDTLIASQGGDTLTGGAGADVLIVKTGPVTPLTFTDFTPGTDKIDISALLPASYHGDAVADLYVVLRASALGGALVYVDPDGGLQTGQNFQFIGELQGVSPWILKGGDFITGVSGASAGAPQFSFATASATHLEGGAGPVTFAYLVTRTGDTAASATVHWSVNGAGADAASASDFSGGALPSGDLTFGIGETSKIISVSVAGDGAVERDETFTVTLSNASGAGLASVSASGVILNDDIDPNASRVLTASNPHTVLTGGGGNDTLNASAAGDTLTGGGGADLFVFATKPWEPTHITDFQIGVDRLDVSAILRSFGYAGADPIADRYVQLADDGAGGTKILFDRDGVGAGQQWPDYAIDLDHTPVSLAMSSSGWLLT